MVHTHTHICIPFKCSNTHTHTHTHTLARTCRLAPSSQQQQQQQLDPPAVAASLVAALDSAASSVGAALHRLALLEVAHWEAERGAEAVGEVRAALAGAAMEMEAGR